jgi:hypothetical protein
LYIVIDLQNGRSFSVSGQGILKLETPDNLGQGRTSSEILGLYSIEDTKAMLIEGIKCESPRESLIYSVVQEIFFANKELQMKLFWRCEELLHIKPRHPDVFQPRFISKLALPRGPHSGCLHLRYLIFSSELPERGFMAVFHMSLHPNLTSTHTIPKTK